MASSMGMDGLWGVRESLELPLESRRGSLGQSGPQSPQLLPKLARKSPDSKKPRDILCRDTMESN